MIQIRPHNTTVPDELCCRFNRETFISNLDLNRASGVTTRKAG